MTSKINSNKYAKLLKTIKTEIPDFFADFKEEDMCFFINKPNATLSIKEQE